MRNWYFYAFIFMLGLNANAGYIVDSTQPTVFQVIIVKANASLCKPVAENRASPGSKTVQVICKIEKEKLGIPDTSLGHFQWGTLSADETSGYATTVISESPQGALSVRVYSIDKLSISKLNSALAKDGLRLKILYTGPEIKDAIK